MADTSTPTAAREKYTTSPPKGQDILFRKDGMGTVAAEDYDEKTHGKVLALSDDEYKRRLDDRFQARNANTAHPPTTLPNLQSFNPAAVKPQEVFRPPVTLSPAVVGKPVATMEDVVDPEKVEHAKHQRESDLKAKEAADKAAADASKK